jgi:malonate-semialdehyde dehydrogenase (acetylating)/methylmalonate-semialdehyde dehydrogenase
MKAVFQMSNISTRSLFKTNLANFSTISVPKLKNFINGEFVESKATNFYEIHNPATNELLSLVPETPKEEFDHAVSVAKNAFKTWRNIPINTRQRYMFDYLRLLKENQVSYFVNFIFLV